jgi:hypothetical protein
LTGISIANPICFARARDSVRKRFHSISSSRSRGDKAATGWSRSQTIRVSPVCRIRCRYLLSRVEKQAVNFRRRVWGNKKAGVHGERRLLFVCFFTAWALPGLPGRRLVRQARLCMAPWPRAW